MRSLRPALLGAFLLACSANNTPPPCDGHCIDAQDAASEASHDGARFDVPTHRTLNSVAITPADQTLHATLGTMATQMYIATGTYSDGSTAPVAGSWSLADGAIGNIDPVSGQFTANGARGGTTTVHFTAASGGPSAMTTLTVDLADNLVPPGSHADEFFMMASGPVTDPTNAASIDYPLDHVVFPQNITAPLVQWTGGVVGDLFRVTYTKPHITIVQYLLAPSGFTFSASIPDTDFSRLAETDPTDTATLTVDRLDHVANRVVSGAPIHMTFAQGSVSGTVYYWAMDEGRLHRVPAGTVHNDALFASLVGTADTTPSYTYSGCVACHQISRDGRYLAANGDEAYVVDLDTYDPATAPVPVRVVSGFRWYFSTISPDNTRVFATMPDTTFAYTDLMINRVTANGTPPTTGVAHPSWSPDGHTVAFISNIVGWTSNAAFTGGDLTTISVDLASDTFSHMQVIHSGSSLASSDPAGGDADCFPSWTPDSRFLVFDHTPDTRGTGMRAPGSLYMMPPTAGATPVRLQTASDDPGGSHTHFPNLSPFASGGYYWIVFYSTRDYGNTLAGTAGTARPQLWVSAISTSFDGTHDPSQVPYWLPGQDTAHQNADAEWAASPCHMTGASCSTSSDCCSGACEPTGDGGFACTTPPMCRREGESCERDSDCCGMGMLVCDPQIHTCQQPIG